MMKRKEPIQTQLFYTDFNLEERVRKDHILRRVDELIDFDFCYEIVEKYYGKNGNPSVPPPIILKLMLLLVLYNVRSERELMKTLPERLDWLWFLGYDLDTDIPNHSVLSKARNRWGLGLFKEFFERIVWQCVKSGLVDGSKIFVDSSFIDANASKNSVIDTQSLKRFSNKHYEELESRLEEIKEEGTKEHSTRVNDRYISSTDPEAAIVRGGKLCYQTHRAVDPSKEIITSIEVTRGDVNEAHQMMDLWEQHNRNTEKPAETIVADSKYGTISNYVECYDRGINAHMPNLKEPQAKRSDRQNLFSDSEFYYYAETDSYLCPAGNSLKRRSYHEKRNSIDYAGSKKMCGNCNLQEMCTRNKIGRTIKRHIEQEKLDLMRSRSKRPRAKKDIKTRQHLIERSFARSKRYGFDRARWRGLSRIAIQEYLVCSIQNIEALIKHGHDYKKRAIQAMKQAEYKITKAVGNYVGKSRSYLCYLAQNFKFKSFHLDSAKNKIYIDYQTI